MNFINYNGKIGSNLSILTTNNRAFRYGDGLFESMRIFHNQIPFLNEHLIRLHRGMKLLGYKPCDCIEENKLRNMILELCEKNEIEGSARVRLSVFRNDGGLYTPESDDFSFLIESSQMENDTFKLDSKALIIGIAKSIEKTIGPLSNIKSSNALNMVLAAREAKLNGWDDALILNNKGTIAEATSSNLFVVKNNIIYTPPIEDGAMDGIMRQQIALLVKNTDYHLRIKSLSTEDIENADEIFLSNAIQGIIRVVGFYEKRFYSKAANLLNKELNMFIQRYLENIEIQ